jgi:hypothetical protein
VKFPPPALPTRMQRKTGQSTTRYGQATAVPASTKGKTSQRAVDGEQQLVAVVFRQLANEQSN